MTGVINPNRSVAGSVINPNVSNTKKLMDPDMTRSDRSKQSGEKLIKLLDKCI